MLYCNYCGHAEQHSLVDHLNNVHEGVANYIATFPGAKLVSPELFGALSSPAAKSSKKTATKKGANAVNGIALPQKSGGDLVPQIDNEYPATLSKTI